MSYYGSEIDQRLTELHRQWRREATLNFWLGFGFGGLLMLIVCWVAA